MGMDKKAGITILLPLILSVFFTLMDIFVMKLLSRHFSTNPKLVVFSFIELYLISAVTMVFLKKEQVAVRSSFKS